MDDSRAIARMLGIDDKTAWAKELVECSGTRCATSNDTHILVVEEQKNEDPTVRVKLYSPGRRLTSAIVYVRRLQNGWQATHYEERPYTVVVKR
jgi:hypothetical protein